MKYCISTWCYAFASENEDLWHVCSGKGLWENHQANILDLLAMHPEVPLGFASC